MKFPTLRPIQSAKLAFAGVLAGSAALVLTGCGESAPQRIESGATVSQAERPAGGEVIQGRSFTDVTPEADPGSKGVPTGKGNVAEASAGDIGDMPMEARPAPSGGMPTFIDPNLAAGLREDPGKTAAGTIDGLITFGDLSLLGADIDELLDYIYKPDTERAKRFKFPEKVIESAGDDKAIVGYMIALEYKARTNDVISFMLVRDLQSCCFGGVPRPDEWVMVEMEEGKTTEYFMYVPVTVRGKFTPGRVEDEYGYASAIYNLEASSVERYEAPAPPEK